MVTTSFLFRTLTPAFILALLVACGGGGGGGASAGTPPTTPPPSEPTPAPPPEPIPEPLPEELTAEAASRFLSQASFGPGSTGIENVLAIGLEGWFTEQLALSPSLHLQDVLNRFPADGRFLDDQGNPLEDLVFAASDSFWEKAITAPDQLRQRMAFALSQILVVSSQSDLARTPQTIAAYMDVLTTGAFENFRELLEDVTYSPAMAVYLTYLRNEKADPSSGRVPDENYARELLQLFTLGLVELGPDGEPLTGNDGQPVELFDNDDITGLAKVFTGLSFSGVGFRTPLRALPSEAYYQPLAMFDEFHSLEEKHFLGTTIAANTDGNTSIEIALDAIFEHPNVGPFLARQLIQRFITSDPTPSYVSRVSQAFDSGLFSLPSGASVGSAQRGDLAATLAAVLFDDDARQPVGDDVTFGKLREPVIRFTHWARAFQVNSADASNDRLLRDTSSSEALGQHPYRSPSVFNFYRPGYIAPGTETGAAGLTAPELQIANASTVIGYPNFMTIYALGRAPQVDRNRAPAFIADYSEEAALADDADALLDHLDLLLTHGTLQADTRTRVQEALLEIEVQSDADRLIRAQLASVMLMTAPEYLVLR